MGLVVIGVITAGICMSIVKKKLADMKKAKVSAEEFGTKGNNVKMAISIAAYEEI